MTISVPLSKAQLCQDCQDISIMDGGSRCPVCESRALIPLSSVLNRPELPRTLPELSEFIQVATPESIRKMLGYPQEGGGL